jgi:hypothetical protein
MTHKAPWRLNIVQGNKWSRFKTLRLAPKRGRQVITNIKEGNLTLNITKKGNGLETDFIIISTI